MKLLYNFGILVYRLLVIIASLFDKKIASMWHGQRCAIAYVKAHRDMKDTAPYVWIHAASLGEFEQGRPIIEKIKREHPEYKILLTFYSPSGYDIQKNYSLADIVCYMPIDTYLNAYRFVKYVNPKMAIFIKYEFWANHLSELHRNKIPTYVVSAIFRKEQAFFQWYGSWYRGLLRNFTTLYVQDKSSAELLKEYKVDNVVVSGDTRFDRVSEIAQHPKELPLIEEFARGSKVLVAGSSWEQDEELFVRYFNKHHDVKLIIAPHVISQEHILNICSHLKRPFVCYSEATPENIKTAECVIIDGIGFLSSIYRFGQVAYIGGGFGVGIHNTLEAAVYGMPVVFGPNYHRFKEAVDMVKRGASFSVSNLDELTPLFDRLFNDEEYWKTTCANAEKYVAENKGGTNLILKDILKK